MHLHQSYFGSIIPFFKISELWSEYQLSLESHPFSLQIIVTNGKFCTGDTQKSILGLLEMTETMAGTSVRVQQQKIDVNFKNIPSTPSHTLNHLLETMNRSGITVLKTRNPGK